MLKDKELDTLLDQLEGWSQSVGKVAKDIIPQVRETIEKDVSLPENCPSKAAMAELELRQIQKPLSEVTGILEMLREHLFEHYGDKK